MAHQNETLRHLQHIERRLDICRQFRHSIAGTAGFGPRIRIAVAAQIGRDHPTILLKILQPVFLVRSARQSRE